MEITEAQKKHLRRIARSGGLALKKKKPKNYFSKLRKDGWKKLKANEKKHG